MARLWLMAMVLQSTTTDPPRTPSTIPLAPRMTSFAMAVSPTQRNRTSAFSATSFGVAQNLPFSVSASFWALAEVLDQTATSCPARRRLRAMGYPMSPSPRNPSLGMKLDCTRLLGGETNRWAEPTGACQVGGQKGCSRQRLVNAGRQGGSIAQNVTLWTTAGPRSEMATNAATFCDPLVEVPG